MGQQNTIVLYESVAGIMKQMLSAAQKEDWDKLTELEQHCARHVAEIKMLEDDQPLPSEALKRKISSIKSILADDREIRTLVTPWMARLNVLMNSNQTGQRLKRAYTQ